MMSASSPLEWLSTPKPNLHRSLGVALALLMTLLSAAPSSAVDPDTSRAAASRAQPIGQGWQLVKEVEGIRIFHRRMHGSAYPQAMARTVFGAPPQRVHAVISDYDHFADFIPYILESETLGRREGIRWVYQRLRFPGPISDRRYIIRVEDLLGQARDGYYRVQWRLAANGLYPIPDRPGVVPTIMSGFWDLRAAADGTQTDAAYVVHLEPGGMLPAWLMSFAADSYLSKVMAAVRNRAAPAPREPLEPGGRASE
jgi:ribosome-associated toxin RatA of RatAB toxin-antitoxin module